MRIDSIAHGGEGIGTLPSGKRVFVPLAAPGDQVEVEIVERRPRYERGRILRVLEPGPERVAPVCPHAEDCGGCQLQHLSIEGQLRAKERVFYDALERLGRIGRDAIGAAHPVLPSPRPFRYRIRARLRASGACLGYLRRQSHELVPIQTCHLLVSELEDLVSAVRERLRERPIPWLAAVEFCVGEDGNGAVALEPGPAAPPDWAGGVESWLEIPGLVGVVVLTVRKGEPAEILGDPLLSRSAPLAPDSTLLFRPDVFAQANAAANEHLVRAAVEELDPRPGMEVLELFAGTGNFSLAVAARGARVMAIEGDPIASALARQAVAASPWGERIRVMRADARRAVDRLGREGRRYDSVLLDPPRTGAREVLEGIVRLGPSRIVYVSCDPATLARDLRILVDSGYRVVSTRPIDMFPQTYHVEGVACLERE